MNQTIFENAEEKLEKLFFEVDINPLFYKNSEDKIVSLNNYKGIFQKEDNKLISIQEKEGIILSNEKALNFGKQIFKKLYPQIEKDKLKVFKVDYPDSMKFCQIRMIDEAVNFEVFDQDNWYPYLEIINSFDHSTSGSYELGFVRELCSNGIGIGTQIHFSMSDGINLIADEIEESANDLQVKFTEMLRLLKNQKMDEDSMGLEVRFAFSELQRINRIESDSWSSNWLDNIIYKLTQKYISELGENKYSALNVISDITSNQIINANKFQSSSEMKLVSQIPRKWIEKTSRRLTHFNSLLNENSSLLDLLLNEDIDDNNVEDENRLRQRR